jgi:hypothetical protein
MLCLLLFSHLSLHIILISSPSYSISSSVTLRHAFHSIFFSLPICHSSSFLLCSTISLNPVLLSRLTVVFVIPFQKSQSNSHGHSKVIFPRFLRRVRLLIQWTIHHPSSERISCSSGPLFLAITLSPLISFHDYYLVFL